MIKLELLGVGLDEKVSSASTGWVVPLYKDTSARMYGWWRYATAVGSSENDDEIFVYGNLALVNYGITSSIMVVTVCVALK